LKPNAYPVLYSFRRCPYAMRARMALHYASMQCEIREVDLKHKPQAMFDISPKGTVPVLHLPDGRVVDESLDIMAWALAQSDPADWLRPDHKAMHQLIDQNDTHFKYHLDRYKYPDRYSDQDGKTYFRQACDFLAGLEQQMEQAAFLFGDMPSMADVALFPFVRQFAAVDRAAFDALPMPHLQQWLSGWLNDARFTSIMVKLLPWQAGEPPVFLISRSGDAGTQRG